MSAYICGNQHFNSIEGRLFDLIHWDNEFYFPYSLRDKFPKMNSRRHHSIEAVQEELGAVMDILRNLNVVTVTLKYASHYEGKVNQEIKEQKEILFADKKERQPLSKRGLYNALRCLSYQIEEEHLDELGGMDEMEKQAMFFLSEIMNCLAHHILINLPSDENENQWEVKE